MDYTKNNNSKIVYTLASRSLKENKGRNTAGLITIAFSLCIVLSILLVALSIRQSNYDLVKDSYQATASHVSTVELDNLSSDSRLLKVGATYSLGYIETPKKDISLAYYNDAMINLISDVGIEGNYPKNKNELLVSQSYLDMTEQNVTIGDTIVLDAGNVGGYFLITGIVDDTPLNIGVSYLFFSKPFIELFLNGENVEYSTYLWLENIDDLSTKESKQLLLQICTDSGLEAEQVQLNSPYFSFADQSMGADNFFGILLMGCIILFAATIVVYTIFYISVGNRIREYGQLRTLGASKKQVKKIIAYEALVLSIVGSAIGILLGWIIGYILQPDGWVWVNTLWATLTVTMFEILVVWLSVLTPAKMASKASPIEAGRYSAYSQEKIMQKAKKVHKRSTPTRIAFLNICRHPKKAALTMLSLGLCGVLFVCAVSLQTNITAEKTVRASKFQYGEYMVELISGAHGDFSAIQQLENPLSENLKQKILAISGIEDIREWKGISGTITGTNESGISNETINIYGYSRQDALKIEKAITNGTADYAEVTNNKGLIITSPETVEKVFGWSPVLGDKVRLTTLDGNGKYAEISLTVMGITKQVGFQGAFLVTDATIENSTGTPSVDRWEIITASKDNMIEQQLISLLQNYPNLKMTTLASTIEEEQSTLDAGWGLLFTIAVLLGVFGVINLINTNTTNVFARKRELGLLQAVGMTGNQLRKSLIVEGLITTCIASFITLVAGFVIGYSICFGINETIATTAYELPWQAATMYFCVLLVVQLVLTVYNVRVISKSSLAKKINLAS